MQFYNFSKFMNFSQKTTGMLHYYTEIDMIFWPTSYQFNKCILKQVLNVILNIFKAIFPFSFRRQWCHCSLYESTYVMLY